MICDDMQAAVLCDRDYTNTERLRKEFREHYERIEELAEKERVLRYHVKEGWEPLCKFLGVDVPEVAFPHVNDTAALQELGDESWKKSAWNSARTGLFIALAVAVFSYMLSLY